MRKIIMILTAAAAAAAASPVFAAEDMTADKVKEFLYVHSIENSEDRDEITSYEYTCVNSDAIDSKKKLEEIGDIENSFGVFSIPLPESDNDQRYYGYEDGDIYTMFETADVSEYLMEMPGREGYYIPIWPEDGEGSYATDVLSVYPNDNFDTDTNKLADAINEADIGEVKDIRLCSCLGMFYYIGTERGDFAVTCHDKVNERREDAVLGAWTVYPLKDYLTFTADVKFDEERAEEKFREELGKIEVPERFVFDGDEPRATNVFAGYIYDTNPFNDTEGVTAKAASLLYDMEVTKGCGDGAFIPGNSLTAEQAGIMVERMIGNGSKYIDGYDPAAALTPIQGAELLMRVLGNWIRPIDERSIFSYTGWMLSGIEALDVNAPLSRGDFAVMLCNCLDRNIMTYTAQDGYGIGTLVMQGDITLIDYINGGRLNGVYVTSQEEQDAYEDDYFTWFYNTCKDILIEYYGEDNEWLMSSMAPYLK